MSKNLMKSKRFKTIVELWMLQCLNRNGNCLIGNARIKDFGISAIEKEFLKKKVQILPIFNGGMEDPTPYLGPGGRKAMNRDISFVAYIYKGI